MTCVSQAFQALQLALACTEQLDPAVGDREYFVVCLNPEVIRHYTLMRENGPYTQKGNEIFFLYGLKKLRMSAVSVLAMLFICMFVYTKQGKIKSGKVFITAPKSV